jgi:hypothetical protein
VFLAIPYNNSDSQHKKQLSSPFPQRAIQPTMSSLFRIVEHVVPAQHIREYPGATANDQEEPLNLAVKQYIPLDNPNPQPGDVTILAAHANGFPKVRDATLPRSRTAGPTFGAASDGSRKVQYAIGEILTLCL